MSPRSGEFLAASRGRLAAARAAAESDAATALSAAYYAMLYAARAALSERDVYAKTHSGLWNEFRVTFVTPGLFDPALASAAQKTQPRRERADYDAWSPPEETAGEAIQLADSFVRAVEELLGAS